MTKRQRQRIEGARQAVSKLTRDAIFHAKEEERWMAVVHLNRADALAWGRVRRWHARYAKALKKADAALDRLVRLATEVP